MLSSANSADKSVNSNLHNKFLMEQYLHDKKLSATFLRPVAFMDNFVLPQWGLQQGVFTTALLPNTKQPLIAVDDIGALAALMFEQGMEKGAAECPLALYYSAHTGTESFIILAIRGPALASEDFKMLWIG